MSINRPLVRDAYQLFLISQPKHMLWLLKRTRWSRNVSLPGVLRFSSELDQVNPGLGGSQFGERTWYNPGSAGLEKGLFLSPSSELW